jgi:hypothetical protein
MLMLLPMCGCARHAPDLPTEGATQTNPTPFQTEAATELENAAPISSADDQNTSPPFRTPDVVPAGSLLTVRLKAPLVGVNGSKAPFEALLDDPVMVDGTALIPRDAVVSGEIESAQVSKARPDRSYLCLTLNSLLVGGVPVPIQSARLYVRHQQPSAGGSDDVTVRLEQGRQLTFRLKEQVFLHPNVSKRGQ